MQSIEPRQNMSLVCHYHIFELHLINEGFVAVVIVIFGGDSQNVKVDYLALVQLFNLNFIDRVT